MIVTHRIVIIDWRIYDLEAQQSCSNINYNEKALMITHTNYFSTSDKGEASSNGLSTRSKAAVGGGAAAGFVLLLSLVALCCCWGRSRSRPKHPPVHFESVLGAAPAYDSDLIPKRVDGSL